MAEKSEETKEWAPIIERYKALLDSESMSDVQFSFGVTKGPTLYAHKVILGAASDVFKSMFYGELKETNDVIAIPDIERPMFLEMMRFIYYGKVNLTPDNVLGILYGAKKYLIPGLVETCREYLDGNLNIENVCTLLDASLRFDEEPLTKKCHELICKDTASVLESEAFVGISKQALGMILDIDTLKIKSEVEVFQAVVCKKQSIATTGENIRNILEDIIYKIRIPTFTADELGKHVAPTGILSLQEVNDILIYISTGKLESGEMKFIKQQRKYTDSYSKDLLVCKRYKDQSTEWKCKGTLYDALKFTTNSDIMLSGLGVFVPHKDTSTPLQLKFKY
ncbi:unnamed protein product [Owenia fusiformis]|uniref:Uncharacterized protein n=1 Tax=Owenia fusiformis TaxID=6347 RepID=A0A8J1UH91_OWEFU|nr:unnamed protein product [Owenia fusiformis]